MIDFDTVAMRFAHYHTQTGMLGDNKSRRDEGNKFSFTELHLISCVFLKYMYKKYSVHSL